MPEPIPFIRRAAAHLAPPPPRAPETAVQRRDRQLELTRELTELNMLAARDAAHRITSGDPENSTDAPAAQDPTLALARATRAVTAVISLENRIAAGETASAFTLDDPRRAGLRTLLHPLLTQEADPVRRRALKHSVDQRIDDALGVDLDDNLPLIEIASVIAGQHGIVLDPAKVPDEYLYPPGTELPDWRARNRGPYDPPYVPPDRR